MTITPVATPATTHHEHGDCGCADGRCTPPAPLERNRFYPRKLMEVRHWVAEQAYHRQARQVVTRLGTGSGVLCGLEVSLTDAGTLLITAGVATDGLGRIVVVPEDLEVDPARPTGAAPTVDPLTEGTVTVAVRYRECGTDLVPVPAESCEGNVRTVPSMVRESYCVTVTPGTRERAGLPDGVCEALGGCGCEDDEHPDLDAEARRRRLDELAPRSCDCDTQDVPLATVTFAQSGPSLDTAARTVIRSNRELLDLILCLADRLDECCHAAPPATAVAPRVTALWPWPDAEGASLKEFVDKPLLEVAFDRDMAEAGLDAPESWLGVWVVRKQRVARAHVERAAVLPAHVASPPGGDAAVYSVKLPGVQQGDVVVVMVRSGVAGVVRANGADGLALDADLTATTLTAAERDALWALPATTSFTPVAGLTAPASVPSPPLPSGDGTAGGELHVLLARPVPTAPPPRLLAVAPAGPDLTPQAWKVWAEDPRLVVTVSRALDPAAVAQPKDWLRLWQGHLDGPTLFAVEEVGLEPGGDESLADGSVRYSYKLAVLPRWSENLQLLWQVRSGSSVNPDTPRGADAPPLLLDADFKGTGVLDSATLLALWTGALQSLPQLDPRSTAGEQLWNGTEGGVAHAGLTARLP